MLTQKQYNSFQELYKKFNGSKADSVLPVSASGSNRVYYRLTCNNGPSLLVAYNADIKENEAFVHISEVLRTTGVKVPEVLLVDAPGEYYLQTDLGDVMLFDFISNNGFSDETITYYKKCLTDLLHIQFESVRSLNPKFFYPRAEFDRQSMQWDLNYFKYNFLKLAQIPFDESLLEEDFNRLLDDLDVLPRNTFMYRDFKSKNVMLRNNELHYIDFQGGRLGNYYYDVASLLYEGIVNMPHNMREELLRYYHQKLQHYVQIQWEEFEVNFYQVLLVRLMQALGAYGYRGLFEKKATFLQSIPPMQATMAWLLEQKKIPEHLKTIKKVLEIFSISNSFKELKVNTNNKLTISINSFSYRKGYPIDPTGNGGGFVFDCRNLINPGRIEEYKMLDGTNQKVIDFLKSKQEVKDFTANAKYLVTNAMKVYKHKGFQNLQVNFGCTGGQHRSVYCAEWLKRELSADDDVIILLNHREKNS